MCGFSVISFGADGNSRELSAMQRSVQLLCKSSMQSIVLPLKNLSSLWSSWFILKKPSAVAFSRYSACRVNFL